MKNALAFAAAATLVLIGVGWYLGWYTVKTTKNADGTEHVDLDVDSNKAQIDVKQGIKTTEKIVDEIKDKSQSSQEPTTNNVIDSSKLNSIVPPKSEVPRLELPRRPVSQPENNTGEPPTFELPPIPLPPSR